VIPIAVGPTVRTPHLVIGLIEIGTALMTRHRAAKNRIFRLEPGLAPNQRTKTPYKWTYSPQEPGRCASRG
jgi:hypothetical protein